MHKPPHANDLILNLKTGIAHYESVDFSKRLINPTYQ